MRLQLVAGYTVILIYLCSALSLAPLTINLDVLVPESLPLNMTLPPPKYFAIATEDFTNLDKCNKHN